MPSQNCKEERPEDYIRINDFLVEDSKSVSFLKKYNFNKASNEIYDNIDKYYCENSCYVTSDSIAKYFIKNNIKCEKIYAIGAKEDTISSAKWGNHQAVLVRRIATKKLYKYKGKAFDYIQTMIFDPFLKKNKPLFLDEWLSLITGINKKDNNQITSKISYIIFPAIYFKPLNINFEDIFNPCSYLFIDKISENDKINFNNLIGH